MSGPQPALHARQFGGLHSLSVFVTSIQNIVFDNKFGHVARLFMRSYVPGRFITIDRDYVDKKNRKPHRKYSNGEHGKSGQLKGLLFTDL